MSLPDDLQKLQALREQGSLTEEELGLAKKRVLEGSSDATPKAERPSPPETALNQLRRSNSDRWVGGVCGGMGESTGIPSWAWRILFVLTAFLHGLGVLMYVLLWIFVPVKAPASQPYAER